MSAPCCDVVGETEGRGAILFTHVCENVGCSSWRTSCGGSPPWKETQKTQYEWVVVWSVRATV